MSPARLGALLLGLCLPASAAAPRVVVFKTRDGWTIAARWRPPREGRPVLVLAHGVGSSKNEWEPLTDRLAAAGVGTLALDLRGHGQSLRGPRGPRDYRDFDADGEWARALEDLRAAERWLEARGYPPSRVALGGASIGANLASLAAERAPLPPFLLLLSPGEDYRGVPLNMAPRARTLVAAAPSDPYAFATLEPLAKSGATVMTAPFGHGAQMFADPPTLDKIVAWILRAARKP